MADPLMTVKISFDLRGLMALFPKILAGFQDQAPKLLQDEIVSSIKKGISPVEGQGRFPGYSPSYDASIRAGMYRSLGKKSRPVNLFLTGTMLGSIYSKPAAKGVTIGFSDKKAAYHNDLGAGKAGTLRRMLPTNSGEKFTRPIMQRVMKLLQNNIIKSNIDRSKSS